MRGCSTRLRGWPRAYVPSGLDQGADWHPLARVATGWRPFGTRSRSGLPPACAGGKGLASLRDSDKARRSSTRASGWQRAGVPSGLDQGAVFHPLARVARGLRPFGTQTRRGGLPPACAGGNGLPSLRDSIKALSCHPLARVARGLRPFGTQTRPDRRRKCASAAASVGARVCAHAGDRRHRNRGVSHS